MTFELQNLEISRGSRLLQTGVNVRVDAGAALWVQGPNGVGKSTLLEAICGFRDHGGQVLWQGQDARTNPDLFHDDLAYIGHKNGNAGALTAREALGFYGRLYGAQARVDGALERMEIAARGGVPVHMLSAGQQKRLALARLALRDVALWVLDEAPVSLDKAGVLMLTDMIGAHLKNGGSVIYTSHVDLNIDAQKLELAPLSKTRAVAQDGFLGAEWDGAL